MSTKKQRLAQRTAGGEPSLSLPAFAAAMPAGALQPSAGACASVPDCYLVYCYLCRTGASGAAALHCAPLLKRRGALRRLVARDGAAHVALRHVVPRL